jgi:hypothetical protein
MLHLESKAGIQTCDGLTRRDFLRAGVLAAGAVGLSLTELAVLRQAGAAPADCMNCILLFLVGGPSQLDTWDLKPDAPSTVRGPFKPIQTNVPGVRICEHFPLMAGMANHYALVRSVHHTAAPIHETGQQLMQTGRLFGSGHEYPHYGAVVSHLRGPGRDGTPPFVVVPGPINETGVRVSHGQTAGFLGATHEPFVLPGEPPTLAASDPSAPCGLDPARLPDPNTLLDAVDRVHWAADTDAQAEAFAPIFTTQAKQAFALGKEDDSVRARYGMTTFGQSCLLARRLVEHGVRFVTVNMFDTVFNRITWDCHADGGALGTRLDDYRELLCPMFDQAYTALLEDLRLRGLLERTLVLAMGEFGRTPLLNARGGRDHWPGCWTILFAGAGVRGGQIIGGSDKHGAEPNDRPVTPAQVAASVYHGLGMDPRTTRLSGPDGRLLPLADAAPIQELF